MSKKKATMTLKDFHGGSIPSDLRLPSAPGVSIRPVDRIRFDRQMSWGSSAGRPEHRVRPASTSSTRNLDEKTPFLSHGPLVGRNFDEDDRKPLDGLSGSRQPIVDESVLAQPSHPVEPKVGSRAASSPANPYTGRVSEVPNVSNQIPRSNRSYGSNYPVMGCSAGQTVTGSYPNAWGVRKEPAGAKESIPAAWSTPDAETKLAHASALEKVSSGRWNSKQHVYSPKDAEVPLHVENIYNNKTHNRPEILAITDLGKEVLSQDRVRATDRVDSSYERNSSVAINGLQSVVPSESSERPRLKLLPRSKPIENLEPPIDYKQTSNQLHVEDGYSVHEAKSSLQSGAGGMVVADRAPERPKLNLKPRSQTTGQPEGNNEAKRGTVFGGARPRELVLKERGIDDDVSSYESQSPLRVKTTTPKADASTHFLPAPYKEKAEAIVANQLVADSLRRNKPSEIHKNNRLDVDKNRNQQPKQDRAPSPETWRKPVDPARPSHGPPLRFGKVASAVELTQAFSKTVSDPTGRAQVPFSRLMGSTTGPQLNGY